LIYLDDRSKGTIYWRPQAVGRFLDRARAGDVIIAAELSYLMRSTLYT
jgi:hypothetical protein